MVIQGVCAQRRLCSAAQRALERMPVQRWAGGGGEGCAVCLEPLQPGELVRRLPCGHCFHQPCVDPWLLEQRSCPMCKMDILRHCAVRAWPACSGAGDHCGASIFFFFFLVHLAGSFPKSPDKQKF